MNQNSPFVITISRQIGSGGGYIAQQLATKLNIDLVDHEILSKAATQLAVLEEDLEARDEKLLSFWESFFHINGFSQELQLPPKMNFPFDHEVFEAEAKIIKHIAGERSSVIIGRCGFHILREHTNCVSLFLHADIPFRSKRIQELYNVPEKRAMEMINKSDKERSHYIETFTRNKWIDARQFNLSVDTGKIGIDKSVELILNYLELIQPETKP